jgi:nitrite reductase/ring-hydroxylating ferredoxin subunit
MKEICQLNEIDDGQAKAFPHPTLEKRTIFIVRQGQQAWAYLNMCPHMGVEMEFQENKFMSFDGTQIQCAMHGALFDISTGFCSWGPCSGQSLVSIEIVNNNGILSFKKTDI